MALLGMIGCIDELTGGWVGLMNRAWDLGMHSARALLSFLSIVFVRIRLPQTILLSDRR